MFLGNCLVSRTTKKHIVVSRSSTIESRYRSLVVTTEELFWLKIPLPAANFLWCENISALALAFNPVFHAGTKYTEVDYHFVCKRVLNRDIIVKFISSY
jgi:hypothetical protein